MAELFQIINALEGERDAARRRFWVLPGDIVKVDGYAVSIEVDEQDGVRLAPKVVINWPWRQRTAWDAFEGVPMDAGRLCCRAVEYLPFGVRRYLMELTAKAGHDVLDVAVW